MSAKVSRFNAKVADVIGGQSVDAYDMHISESNDKLGDMHSIATQPIACCPGATDDCVLSCYWLGCMERYEACAANTTDNAIISIFDRGRFFAEISDHLQPNVHPRIYKDAKRRIFRWHAGGDIQDQNYLDRMIDLANNNPTWLFYGYTKSDRLDFSRRPRNLRIIQSCWQGKDVVDLGLDGYSWYQNGTETRIPADSFECPCDEGCVKCQRCAHLGQEWNGEVVPRNVVFPSHGNAGSDAFEFLAACKA